MMGAPGMDQGVIINSTFHCQTVGVSTSSLISSFSKYSVSSARLTEFTSVVPVKHAVCLKHEKKNGDLHSVR